MSASQPQAGAAAQGAAGNPGTRTFVITLVLGGIIGFLLFAMFFPPTPAKPEAGPNTQAACQANLEQIARTIKFYRGNHNGADPPGLKDIADRAGTAVTVCPAVRPSGAAPGDTSQGLIDASYVYVPYVPAVAGNPMVQVFDCRPTTARPTPTWSSRTAR